jgi:hypothetical protein
MFGTNHPVLASPGVNPGFLHALANALGGLSGAALVIALIGAAIGYAVACAIDWLPAPIGIILGIFGTAFIVGIV